MMVGLPPSTRFWTQLRSDLSVGKKGQLKMTRENQALKASQVGAGENGETSLTALEIGRRAYEIFVERGSVHGHDLDHWLKAEHELKEKADRDWESSLVANVS